MATTISQSGGVGLADMMMRQFGAGKTNAPSGKMNNLSNAIAAVKDIKETKGIKNLRSENKIAPLANRSAKSATVNNGIPPENRKRPANNCDSRLPDARRQ